MAPQSKLRFALTVAVATCSALPLGAQDPAVRDSAQQSASQARPPAAADRGDSDASPAAPRSDAALAQWLIDDHQREIALNRWAEERFEVQEAISYAKRMIEDHEQMVAQLEEIARDETVSQAGSDDGGVTVDTPEVDVEIDVDREEAREAARRAREAARRAAERAANAVDRVGERRSERRSRRDDDDADQASRAETRLERRQQRRGGVRRDRELGINPRELDTDWLRIKEQLTERKIRSAQRNLERYRGEKQMEAFLALQLVHHQEMLDTLAVFEKYASPELARAIEENSEKVHANLQMAGKLMEQVSSR